MASDERILLTVLLHHDQSSDFAPIAAKFNQDHA
jgi:hypothetical protein